MTDDYKEKLIQYATNNFKLSEEVETTINGSYDIVKETTIDTSVGSSMFNFIAELLLEVDRSNIRINGMLQVNNSSTKVIYGGYSKTDSTTSEGFLILIDGDYNGITMLREYESGTKIREVQFLAQDENNNIYGVVGDTTQAEQKYFTMLNNFTIAENGSYVLRLRKNYSLADTYFRCIDITKKEGESEYLIVGFDLIEDIGIEENLNGRGINFKINVGSANEITRLYNRGNLAFPGFAIYSNYNDSGEPYIKVIAQSMAGDDFTAKVYINQNGTTSNIQIINYSNFILMQNIYRVRQTKDDNGGIYFQVNAHDMDDYSLKNYALYYLDKNNTLHTISGDTNSSYQVAWTVINNGWYDENNVGRPFLIQHAAQYNEDDDETIVDMGGIAMTSATDVPTTMYSITSLVMYPNYSYENFPNQLITLSNRNFNLLSIFTIQSDLTTDSPANILTILKRPGLQLNKQDTFETFQPKYVDIIKDNEVKFSRNIYDSVVYSNTSVDSVEVPYNYLNNVEVDGQNLYGAKNMEFVKDSTQWTKNRYENLDINFINKINVSNRDTSENLLSQAVKLNKTIHYDIYFSIGTANILYSNGTFDDIEVKWYPLTQYTYQATINFTPEKEVVGIDWSYSLNGMEFITNFDTPLASGTNHTIKQKITINDEFYKTNLQYNGINVQYNDEDVLVQSKEE